MKGSQQWLNTISLLSEDTNCKGVPCQKGCMLCSTWASKADPLAQIQLFSTDNIHTTLAPSEEFSLGEVSFIDKKHFAEIKQVDGKVPSQRGKHAKERWPSTYNIFSSNWVKPVLHMTYDPLIHLYLLHHE